MSLRILFISYFFPPFNTVGALRTGKFAEYLGSTGHDVRVITARDQPYGADLAPAIPPEKTLATSWLNLNSPLEWLRGGREKVKSQGLTPASNNRARFGRKFAEKAYRSILHLPDAQGGWICPAIKAGRHLLSGWKPDLIYASCSPFSSLLIAKKLSDESGIPWFAEFRDLWAYNPYESIFSARRTANRWLEAKTLKGCAGIVVVNDAMKGHMEKTYGMPCISVPNGFDDRRPVSASADAGFSPNDGQLHLVYTGQIYPGARDPRRLFDALQLVPKLPVRVHFFGRNTQFVRTLAVDRGVEEKIELHGAVTHDQSLAAQSAADILLFVIPSLETARDEVSAKFYEYLSAEKIILGIGPKQTAVAGHIAQLRLGLASDDPKEIAYYIRARVEEKQSRGSLDFIRTAGLDKFSRRANNERLERWLQDPSGSET